MASPQFNDTRCRREVTVVAPTVPRIDPKLQRLISIPAQHAALRTVPSGLIATADSHLELCFGGAEQDDSSAPRMERYKFSATG
jgi:hypothetical protein